MAKPVFYIGEAPTFSAGEIMVALLVLLLVLVGFIAFLIAGIKGFYRLGEGERDSFLAKGTPVIAILDLLLFLTTFREALWFAVAPFAAHLVAFVLGVNAKPGARPTLIDD